MAALEAAPDLTRDQLAAQMDGAEVIAFPHPSDGDFFNLAHGSVSVPGAPAKIPYTVSVPTELVSPIANLIVPGFGGFKRSSRGLRDALAANEQTVAISFGPSRGGGHVNDILHAQKVHADTIAAIAQDLPNNKPLADTPNGDKINFDQLALIAHSMGGLAATHYALEHSEETSHLIYMAAVGLEEPHVLRFIPRLAPVTGKELVPAILKSEFGEHPGHVDLARRMAHYYLSNLGRTAGEIASCVLADVRPHLPELSARDVKTAMLYFGKDLLVPAEPAIKASGHLVNHAQVIDHLDHLAPQKQPAEVAQYLGSISNKLLEA